MPSIALIGADGAGKTTIADRLRETLPIPMKYIYMGMNMESSNFALPTSRLMQLVKVRKFKKSHGHKLAPDKPLSLHHMNNDRKKDQRGKIGATLRLINRMAEEWYRQLVSWFYQWRGFVVLYDRHFIFDRARDSLDKAQKDQRFSDRVHRWSLNNLYAQPDLVIFLDAPAQVLFDRKGEADLAYLQARRDAFLAKGRTTNNFHIVDATQPLDKVFADVNELVDNFLGIDASQQKRMAA